MAERDQVLVALVKEVLGPRQGPLEVLPADQDPRGEYITGILAPADSTRAPDDIDADVDELIEEASGEEDESGEESSLMVTATFSPALDPKALPRSIGLSFSIQTEHGMAPQIEICATWARYRQEDRGWQREPDGYLTGRVQADREQRWPEVSPGVSIEMRSRPLVADGRRISLFLINTSRLTDSYPATSDLIFQPQIRVHCCEGTRLIPVWTGSDPVSGQIVDDSIASESASLSLLYRNKSVLARGHLCGATWSSIDPERPHETLPSPAEAPFFWTDNASIPESKRGKFSPADVRTELIPCFPVEAPQMEWPDEYGPPPALDPGQLAETWQPEDLRLALNPLVEGYENWMVGQLQEISDLPPTHQAVASDHLAQCRSAASRIREAIDILAADEEARLAFCMANKAISLQSDWLQAQGKRDSPLHWRPFQLAFILLNIPAITNPSHRDRLTCDLLWFPTGGGKTEAYLGLMAFTLTLRRRGIHNPERSGAGVGVLSRYTLRLLTIQQFRRALGVITACETLRVHNLDSPGKPVGWRPAGCSIQDSFLWGGVRFSAGLWVGGGVTPNSLHNIGPIWFDGTSIFYVGALGILQGASRDRDYEGPDGRLRQNLQTSRHLEIQGEPAQILSCPCCESILAVPDEGLDPGPHTLHFVFAADASVRTPLVSALAPGDLPITVETVGITAHESGAYTLSISVTVEEANRLTAKQVDQWWYRTIETAIGSQSSLLAARPSRPGYFITNFENMFGNLIQNDFEIYCPDPTCHLNQHAWAEQVPLDRNASETPSHPSTSSHGVMETSFTSALPPRNGFQWQSVPAWLRYERNHIARRIPIPAYTVDDQIYHRCPSLLIATVDKFARIAFEPRAAAMFGNVDHYHGRWGYYRAGCPPPDGGLKDAFEAHPRGFSSANPLRVPVPPFSPPDLILQDELHLIEGPLGSLVGLYETAIDELSRLEFGDTSTRPKYIASTATVRQAETQVRALFDRSLAQFPPPAVSIDDRFFARDRADQDIHPLDSERRGRLYAAVCAPGKGAQTPIVRIWSALLQYGHERFQGSPDSKEVDGLYTLVGYFNAVRELAGAVALFRQDIPERLAFMAGADARPLDRVPVEEMELSGRTNSLDLPGKLERLSTELPLAQDALFTTSMFGTGVDVDRLGLMVIHGQPKTTAAYIQATGRVGRQRGALVVTFLRASRPRDLDHYEYFTGYHRELYRHVEPVTVAPFSPRARERAAGPVAVALLRNARALGQQLVDDRWRVQQRLSGGFFSEARQMLRHRHSPEVQVLPDLLERRAQIQPPGRRPALGMTKRELESELDRWASVSGHNPDTNLFVYHEPALLRDPQRDVVLGDSQHRARGLREVYENAPQSLREVEETTGFRT